MTSGTVRTAAARARARRGAVVAGDAATLRRLHGRGWRLVEARAGDRRVILLAHSPDHAPPSDADHVMTLWDTRARVLLGVLAATRAEEAATPWPGEETTVRRVLRLLGGARIPEGTRRHYVAAFEELAGHGLVELPGCVPGAGVGADTPVRVGPAIAAWAGPWLDELEALLRRVTEGAGRVDAGRERP